MWWNKGCGIDRALCRIGQIATIMIILCVMVSGTLRADEGTSDPDFDYLPPEEISMFSLIKTYATSFFRSPSHAASFTIAKRHLYNNVKDKLSFYCGCKMNLAKRTLDRASCGYKPKKDSIRAKRIEAEHILPAYWIAKSYTGKSCWVKDEKKCGGARKCCLKNDERFKKAHNDLVNLTPAIGELNNARSNHSYGLIDGEPRLYGKCDFEVNTTQHTTEPKESIRGDVARVYFYMRDTYSLKFSPDLTRLLQSWDNDDPVSEWEILRNKKIKEIQGTSNPSIK